MKKLLLILVLLSGTILLQTGLEACYTRGEACSFDISCCSGHCIQWTLGGPTYCE